MKYFFGALGTILVCSLIMFGVYVSFFPSGRALINRYNETMKKVDDDTTYETQKQVEDNLRASISSYTADKLTYEQYKDSENEEKRSWSEQARMRANKTASIYNNYFTKNSYVFKNNIPVDLPNSLPYINDNN